MSQGAGPFLYTEPFTREHTAIKTVRAVLASVTITNTCLTTYFNYRTDNNLKILHKSPPGSWPVCFTVGVGAKWHFRHMSPYINRVSDVVTVSSQSRRLMRFAVNGGARNFHFGGNVPGVWGKAVCRHCLQIVIAETINIWKFRTIHLPTLNHYVSRC